MYRFRINVYVFLFWDAKGVDEVVLDVE